MRGPPDEATGMSELRVTVVGAGLAGSEAALQLAARGIHVTLHEMKPKKRTPAQTSATRHEYARVKGTSSTGASAQPRLPVMPCTL